MNINAVLDNFGANVRGDFKCEMVRADTGVVVDSHEEHNLIMSNARNVISRLFAGMLDAKLPDTFRIGTAGTTDGEILLPKDSTDGFVKERVGLFSAIAMTKTSGDVVDIIKDSHIDYRGADRLYDGIYRYTGNSVINVVLSDITVQQPNWELVEELPEQYETTFTMPGTSNDHVNGDDANATNDAEVKVLISGTSITFKLELGTDIGNGEGTRFYTEAGIFAGDDIFCMKTFPAKIKDQTVIFRVHWTITF